MPVYVLMGTEGYLKEMLSTDNVARFTAFTINLDEAARFTMDNAMWAMACLDGAGITVDALNVEDMLQEQ
jgi:hypothetical protein